MVKNIAPALLKVIEETAISCAVDIYDIEYQGETLRLLITKPEGITVDQCAIFSGQLAQRLDLENLIPTRYFLEVSSPGIERKLRNRTDFEQSIDKTVSLNTNRGNFIGKLLTADEKEVSIINIAGSNAKAGTEMKIAVADINFARVVLTDEELVNELRSQKSKNNKEPKKQAGCEAKLAHRESPLAEEL